MVGGEKDPTLCSEWKEQVSPPGWPSMKEHWHGTKGAVSLHVLVALKDMTMCLSQEEWGTWTQLSRTAVGTCHQRVKVTSGETQTAAHRKPWCLVWASPRGRVAPCLMLDVAGLAFPKRCMLPPGPKAQAISLLTPSPAPHCLQELV